MRIVPHAVRSPAQDETMSGPVQMSEVDHKKMHDVDHQTFPQEAAMTDKDVDAFNFRNPEGNELSAQQRKMALVSQALEDTGMGRYQWCIFFLCGFGYALDLMWAQAFGLIMPRAKIELNVSDKHYGDIFSVFSAGLTVGAFTWGILVDVIGRRWAFNLTCGITAGFGLILGALNTYGGIVAITFFVGFGLGGNIPIDATITLEFLPQRKRWLLVALSIFQPIGVIITSLICWGLVPKYACSVEVACSTVAAGVACCTKKENYGWRYSMFALGGISVLAFVARFVLFNFRESPRFLITRGKDAEAVEVCAQIARFNKKEPTLMLEQLQAIDAESGESTKGAHIKSRFDFSHLKRLFNGRKMATLTILTWLVYMCDYWGFTISGSFLPDILARRGADQGVSIDVTYRNYILISIAGMPGVALGAVLVEIPRIGRKWAMVFTSAMMATSLFLYVTVTSFNGSVGLNAMEYFFQSAFNAVLYGWTPEAFPAAVRGSAAGLASFWGRLTSIVAPLIAANVGTYGKLYLAGGGVFIATVLTAFLPDTRRVDVL